VIFGATAASMLAGGSVGALFIYGYQHEATDHEYWSERWSSYRRRFGADPAVWRESEGALKESILRKNDYEYLKLIAPSLPRITCPAQVKSIRFLVPLCGASEDMEVIEQFMSGKISEETESEEVAQQYRLKIIGMDFAKDAVELFMDRMDLKAKGLTVEDVDYGAEYNFKGNHSVYQIDDDIFSKKQVYKQGPFHLILSDIFDAAAARLILRADAVFDKEALSVIAPRLRPKYMNLMSNVMDRKTKILLVTERFNVWDRDPEQQDAAPFSIDGKEELFRLFSKMINAERANIRLLESTPWSAQKLREYGFPQNYDGAFTDIWFIQCQRR